MPTSAFTPHVSSPVITPLLRSALNKLQDFETRTWPDPKATAGPWYSAWSAHERAIDLPTLSAAYRLSKILPGDLEAFAQELLKPASIVVLEIKDQYLIDEIEHVLERGFFATVRAAFDYVPQVNLITPKNTSRSAFSALSVQKEDKVALPTALLSQAPSFVLCEARKDLPSSVIEAATRVMPLPSLTTDEINFLYRIVNTIPLSAVLPRLLCELPENSVLAELSLEDVFAALRQPSAAKVANRIRTATSAKPQIAQDNALDDVIGLGSARGPLLQIARDLGAWKSGQLEWAHITRGVLLYGAPGVGKTFCAQKLAAQCGAHFVPGSYAEWQRHGHLGDMLSAMARAFAEARENAPSILFIDEVDAFGDRQTAAGDNANYTRTVINALLEKLDGALAQEGVLVIAATNYPELLDAALTRSGRFDFKIELPKPGKQALASLLRLYGGADLDSEELHQVATGLVGKTGADIAALVRQARALARQKGRNFSVQDLRAAADSIAAPISAKDLQRIALHEAGHAVVGHALGKGVPARAFIDAKGGAVTFAASALSLSAVDLEAEMVTLLAGRASEEVFLDGPSAGAGGDPLSDLAMATRLALQLECEFGLGNGGLTWRPVTKDTMPKLLADPDLAQKVEARLRSALEAATSLVQLHQKAVERIATALVDERELNDEYMKVLLEVDEQLEIDTPLPDLAEHGQTSERLASST